MKLHESNWPLLTVSKGYFDGIGKEDTILAPDNHEEMGEPQWEDVDIPDDEDVVKENRDKSDHAEDELAADGWDDGSDLTKDLEGIEIVPSKAEKSFVVLPPPGPSFGQIWCNNSNLAADHIAAGSFESAMKLLNQQVGAVNFSVLKSFFMSLYLGSHLSLPGLPSVPALSSPLQRNLNSGNEGRKNSLPELASVGLQTLIVDDLKAAYRSTTGGKFTEALAQFLQILHSLLFIVVESKKEVNEAKELLAICREYITGLRLELQRKELAQANGDLVKQAELAAYFTHCNLQPVHLMLSLRSAMNCAYKIKNFNHAASFARRLLDLAPKEDIATQARKVVKFSEQNNENAQVLNYNERNPFVVCGISFVPIYKGSPVSNCPFCQAAFLPEHKGKLCTTCQLSEIGREVSGLALQVNLK